MQIKDFKEIIQTFVDPGSELLFERDRLVISVNDELIEANIIHNCGDLFIVENGNELPASRWIIQKLAKLQLLASRLCEYVKGTSNFVTQAGEVLPVLSSDINVDVSVETDSALDSVREMIEDSSAFESTVIYLTSDAGEGKTSLINELAHQQAKKFLNKESNWILVPVTLGGRHFLRFDDITAGALQNRYRFPFLYYKSFIALVKMGVIVPAFDGFEEMFVEGSSGEALSAMGILVSSLESQGSVVVAARNAYFEYENLKSTERLHDTIRNYSVSFGKVKICRWGKTQFLEYCKKRQLPNPQFFYEQICARLGQNHAIVTRAVLVKNLVDLAQKYDSISDLLENLNDAGANYFSVFVRSLIEREAEEKWVDRSGKNDVGLPLMTIDEHIDLLSYVAASMWESKVDYVKRDGLEFVAEYFCEISSKTTDQAEQIKERIRGHAMLITSGNASGALEFDHEEFKNYFLGEAVARQLDPKDSHAKPEILSIFRRGVLPQSSLDTAIQRAKKKDLNTCDFIHFLLSVSHCDSQASYTHENCSYVISKLLKNIDGNEMVISQINFPNDALRDANLRNVKFEKCFFGDANFDNAFIKNVSFVNCNFMSIHTYKSTSIDSVVLDKCTVNCYSKDGDTSWDPNSILRNLVDYGFILPNTQIDNEAILSTDSNDIELQDIEKLIRYFMRSTHISESVIKIKLSSNAQRFIDETIPELIEKNILNEIPNRGGVEQRRFKLGMPLSVMDDAIAKSKGVYERFLDNCMSGQI